MKRLLFIILVLLCFKISFCQSHYLLLGKTNVVKEGKAILLTNSLCLSDVKSDTAKIINYAFQFEGELLYPERRRIEILDIHQITEPFYMESDSQNIFIDSSSQPHDLSEIGLGVLMSGSSTNDEYLNKYLSQFKIVNELREFYYSELNHCDSITDWETQKSCFFEADSIRIRLKTMRDSILHNYVSQFPDSKITPWLLEDAVYYKGYCNLYQQVFNKIEPTLPVKMKLHLDSLLVNAKLTAIGSKFPLVGFINSKITKDFLHSNKYTLVDFWFMKCRPCIGQFQMLKDVYNKYSDKGFEIVAISIDKESDLPIYKKFIIQNDYQWKQILDPGGVKAKEINISKYPTNFLLDNSGKIIAVDIKPIILESYLEKNL